MNRKQKRLFRYAVDLFEEMSSKLSHRKINYKANNLDTEGFEYWLSYFGINVGEEFTKRFLEYSMTKYFSENRGEVYRTIRIQWFFSKKAIERWEKNNPRVNTFVIRKFKQKTGLNTAKRKTDVMRCVSEVRNAEEIIKGKYFGENKGFVNCKIGTTLYLHLSSFCSSCKFAEECKEMLKKEYPLVYNKRGYNND